MRLTVLAALFLIAGFNNSYAEYNSTELFIIGWGEGESEFISSPSAASVDPGTPEDPTDDFFLTGNGCGRS